MANNNIFLGGADPLLSSPNQYGYPNAESQLNALREQERRLMEQLQQGPQPQPRPAQNSSPIWDEIDKEFDSLTTMQQKALTDIRGFILDDDGKLDASLYDEVSKIFDEMPLQNMDVMSGFADVTIGRGRIELHLHKNMLTSFLMPNSGKITLTKSDIKELFDMATKK